MTTSKIGKHDLDENLVLPISNGGTGATNATDALSNLGGVSATEVAELHEIINNKATKEYVDNALSNVEIPMTVSQIDITAGVTELADGALYLVYE